ncbi:hypothetical protein ACFQ1E_12120 [Sphingomonas canadensis]|uniref:Uncharacterized protein n=1 Tax=Sphingomonas canadensis TaxID=1219257 RepID=A0ABW3H6I7_9SPHN|nr:hypothetical protein [Sphingomonas canadensis]MCW3836780.1 hypothetical protein [Sphingomonas canadensis]
MADDSLSGLSAGERARIAAMMAEGHPEGGALDEEAPSERAGPLRRFVRVLLWLLCLAILAAALWHAISLSFLAAAPAGALASPLPLTIGLAMLAIILLLWFDGRPLWTPLLLLGLASAAMSGISMRWIDSTPAGVREHWAGIERQRVRLGGDLCYRIDGAAFALRDAGGRGFTYPRGLWPGSFSEAEFRRYFFSDAPMRAGADGWTCVVRG